MKKVVAFLLAFLIFVTPVTTLVKADVVIGDNDDTIINENASILGRKLAMLESLSELALSGVTEFSISNASDVDNYLESLWGEINDAIDYLDSGEWVGDIPEKVASKYYTNLVNYRDVVNNRGQFLGFDLQNPATSLLSTYFANDIYGKKYTSTNLYNSLDMFRGLSRINRTDPEPEIEPNYLTYIRKINTVEPYGNLFVNLPSIYYWGSTPLQLKINPLEHSYLSYYNGGYSAIEYTRNGLGFEEVCASSNILDLNINDTGNGNYIGVINGITKTPIYYKASEPNNTARQYTDINGYFNSDYQGTITAGYIYTSLNNGTYTYSGTLEQVLSYYSNRVRNVNIYVNGDAWSIVSDDTTSSPTLNIDGIIKIYGNDNAQQYGLQPNTQIDYDQLYQVIYNAIRDNLPISQGDINYYDSHDTIYSPTIINNYGEEEGDESDLIDTILDYAVIPKFDTAIAQPMRQALTNGVVIMNNSITNVIPNEILLILGACFFLLLFAVVINRMIK